MNKEFRWLLSRRSIFRAKLNKVNRELIESKGIHKGNCRGVLMKDTERRVFFFFFFFVAFQQGMQLAPAAVLFIINEPS